MNLLNTLKRIFHLIVLSLIMVACSNSDDLVNEETVPDVLDITVLGDSENQIYEYTLNNGVISNEVNLTASLGLPATLERFDVDYPFVNFIELTENENNFNLYQKNLVTGEQLTVETICGELVGSQLAYQPIISQNKIGLFFYQFNGGGYPDFTLKILDKTTGSCEELFIGNGGFLAYRDTLVYQDRLLLIFQVGEDQFKLLKINLQTSAIEDELTFDTNFWGTINNDLLYLLLDNSQLVSYNLSDFSFEAATAVNFELTLANGLNRSQIFGDELEVFIPYQQPSIFEGAPGTISLTTGQLVRGNNNYLNNVKERLEFELSSAIDFTTFNTDIETNTVVFGFRKLSTNQTEKGGVAFGNFDGEITQIVELPEVPFSIIKN